MEWCNITADMRVWRRCCMCEEKGQLIAYCWYECAPIPCPSLCWERCVFPAVVQPGCCQLKIVPQLCILSQLASVGAKCNVSERHVKASQQSPCFTPNQIEDLAGRIRFSALRVPGHASDNKHTGTHARCSLVFSLSFPDPLFTSCASSLLWGLLAGLELLRMSQRTRVGGGGVSPLLTCFPLLTVAQIPTDTISYLKQ